LESLYQILGVSESANNKELNSAYRKLAKKYHPDLNRGDKEAEEYFKLISRAYEVLSDPEKRARYEHWRQHTPTEEGHQRQQRKPYPRSGYTYEAVRPTPYRVKGLYFYIFGGMVVFIYLCVLFYQKMERLAAEKMVADAKTLILSDPYRANSLLREALEKAPDYPEAHFVLAQQLLAEKGNELPALLHLDQAISQSEADSAKYYFARGKLRSKLDDHTAALQDLEKAMVLDPKLPEIGLKVGNEYLYHLNQPSKALSFFEHELRQSPQNAAALLGKAVALQDQHQYARSETYLIQVKSMQPNWPQVDFYLGINALNFQKDTALACSYWRDAQSAGSQKAATALKKHCNEGKE